MASSSSFNGTPTPESVKALADGLTKAQRGWLMRYGPDKGRGYWPLRNALKRKGLIGPPHDELTALGRDVREVALRARAHIGASHD